MANIGLVFLVFAFVCFVLAAFNVAARWNLIAAGLAFWVGAEIFGGAARAFGWH
jgi:hypothetical protein